MFGRILAAGWIFLFACALFFGLFPRLVSRIPHPELIPFFVFPFVLVSFLYGIGWIYRQGMKRVRRR